MSQYQSQKTILYANTIDYNFPLQQRPHHIMNILSERGYKVYWVNQTQIPGKMKDIINPNLEVYHNWEVFKKRIPKVDIYFSSWSFRHVDLNSNGISADLVIYDSLDNFTANEHQETAMINKADILLTTSSPLYNLRKNQHSNIHMCRNGCFPELGDKKYDIPIDLLPYKKNGKPIILFSGALADWCDLKLVEKVANKYQLIVVGKPWNITMPKGVIYLGSKKYEELQAYYSHCDVSILPFIPTSQTCIYSNPIKNYEAMSHGKITIATKIPETVIYPDAVFFSRNHDEFMENIKKALRIKNDPNIILRCKKTAKDNSWYHRVDTIECAIGNFVNERKV